MKLAGMQGADRVLLVTQQPAGGTTDLKVRTLRGRLPETLAGPPEDRTCDCTEAVCDGPHAPVCWCCITAASRSGRTCPVHRMRTLRP